MKSPFTGGKTRLERKWTTEHFRKEPFSVCMHYYVCDDTGQSFSTDALDTLNMNQVHNQYRAKHHIPFPTELHAIREQYGLSAAKMSEVLDLGANSFRNYENGEIPSLANAKLIRMAAEPSQFRQFVEEKEDKFSVNGYKKVMAHIQAMYTPDQLEPLVDYIWNHHAEANAFTGFVKPNLEKVAHFVLYFAQQVKPLKTKLNKLLFYADFQHFRQTGFAISGCSYRAIKLGPVPSHFSELFGLLEDQGYIQIEHKVMEKGVGERFVPQQTFDANLFSEDELAVMDKVVDAFRETKTTEIVDLSHEEPAWLDNHEAKKLIDYSQYSFLIKGFPPGATANATDA